LGDTVGAREIPEFIRWVILVLKTHLLCQPIAVQILFISFILAIL